MTNDNHMTEKKENHHLLITSLEVTEKGQKVRQSILKIDPRKGVMKRVIVIRQSMIDLLRPLTMIVNGERMTIAHRTMQGKTQLNISDPEIIFFQILRISSKKS
jgi:hypothetical protein